MDFAFEILYGYCQAFVGFFYPSQSRQMAIVQYAVGIIAMVSVVLVAIGIVLASFWPQAGSTAFLLGGIILVIPAAMGGYLIELKLSTNKDQRNNRKSLMDNDTNPDN